MTGKAEKKRLVDVRFVNQPTEGWNLNFFFATLTHCFRLKFSVFSSDKNSVDSLMYGDSLSGSFLAVLLFSDFIKMVKVATLTRFHYFAALFSLEIFNIFQ